MAKADPNLYCQTDLENAEPRIVNGVPKTCVLNLGNGLMLQIVPGKLIDDQYSASKVLAMALQPRRDRAPSGIGLV